MLPGKGKFGKPCWNCYLRNPTLDKRMKMDGRMVNNQKVSVSQLKAFKCHLGLCGLPLFPSFNEVDMVHLFLFAFVIRHRPLRMVEGPCHFASSLLLEDGSSSKTFCLDRYVRCWAQWSYYHFCSNCTFCRLLQLVPHLQDILHNA